MINVCRLKDKGRSFRSHLRRTHSSKIRTNQSERVRKRKYPHRLSRKGYIGLQEEEVNSGWLDPGEKPDRAILWKKARKSKDPKAVIDEELAQIYDKIDYYIEKKLKGEFTQSGSSDVLSAALEKPEHNGRVRGVGSFVTPSLYFNLPRGRRNQVTKDELLARDKQREEEFNKRTEDYEKKQVNLMQQIAEFRALIGASNLHSSPILSDKASCRSEKEEQLEVVKELLASKLKAKPVAAKELIPDESAKVPIAAKESMSDEGAKDYFVVDPIEPRPPPEKKGLRKCELAVGRIENKVAFDVVFIEDTMCKSVHGVPLQPGHVRVSVDGSIHPDAFVPVPVPGEIEMVHQAVGSHLAWPHDLIIYTPTVPLPVERKRKEKEAKGDLQKMQALFNNVKLKENVPERYKLLYKHAGCVMKETGISIPITCDLGLFGIERTI